jgi:hypothetical protein
MPGLLGAAIAAVLVGGLVFVAAGTSVGSAPGNGQRQFDAPGCEPASYAGPGAAPHYLRLRNCPRPKAVIFARVKRSGSGWRVTWDGSRSFDPVGQRLVGFEWALPPGHHRAGPKIVVHYRRPGPHVVVLHVIDDSGSVGTAGYSVNLR